MAAAPAAAPAATLASGETALWTLEAPGYARTWDVAASPGDRLIVTTAQIDGGVNPEIHIAAGGSEEAASTGAYSWRRLDHVLVGAGPYTVTVSESGANNTGWFAVALAIIPGAATSAADPDGGALASGETKVASISGRADTDIFQFTGDAGDRVLVTTAALGGSTVSPEVTLYPPAGEAEAVDLGSATTHGLEHVLAASGTYTVIVNDNGFNTDGAYAISLVKMPGDATSAADTDGGPIASGETKYGYLWANADTDVYQFQADPGDRVLITAAAYGSSVSPEIYLYGPGAAGLVLSRTGAAQEERLEASLAAGGAYTIVVSDYGLNAEGAYAIALAKMPGAATSDADTDGGPIAPGETKVGTLAGEADTDLYQFEGHAGDRVVVTTAEIGGNVQPAIYLYAPAGGALEASDAANFTEHRLECTLARDGTYTIVVADATLNSEGYYAIALAQMPGPTTSASDPDGGTIVSGQTKTGVLSNHADTDLYAFYGEAGDRVVITAAAPTGGVEPELYLYPPGGGAAEKSVTAADAPAVYRLDTQLEHTGVYTILVEDGHLDESGVYSVSLARIPGPTSCPTDNQGGTLRSRDTRTGSLVGLSDTDLYQFYGQAGDHVVLTAATVGAGAEPELYLYPPGGGAVEASATGGLTSKRLEQTLLADGLYTVIVNDYGLNGQAYYALTYSNTTSASRLGVYNPFPPDGSTVLSTEASLRWDAVPGAQTYDVYFGKDPLGPLALLATVAARALPVPEKELGTVYSWRVVAHTAGGDVTGPVWWFTFMKDPVVYTDDFTDGNALGDPDWYDLSRSWTVTSVKQFVSNARYDNRAVYKDLPRFLTGDVQTKFKVSGTMASANASILFSYQDDGQRYRYVTVKGGKLTIGQAGTLGDQAGGVKRTVALAYALNRIYRLRVTFDSVGTVKVYFNGATTPKAIARFTKAVPGWLGYGALRTKSTFDDFRAALNAVLP